MRIPPSLNWILQLAIVFLLYYCFVDVSQVSYGVEEDSWTAIQTAFEAQKSGEYTLSRLPGHPIFEYLLRWTWNFHTWAYIAFNFIGVGMILFAFKDFKNETITPGLLLFTTVIGLTILGEAMEYSLALASLVLSWYFGNRKAWFWSAVFLAISTGFRLPNLIFGLPLFLLIWKNQNISKSLLFGILTFVISTLFYLTVYLKYGSDFFGTYSLPYPPIFKALYKASIGTFGVLGSVGILINLMGLHWKKLIRFLIAVEGLPYLLAFGFASLLYVLLPEKSAFMLPVVVLLFVGFSTFGRKSIWNWTKPLFVLSFIFFSVDLVDEYRGAPIKATDTSIQLGSQQVGLKWIALNQSLAQGKRVNKLETTKKIIERLKTQKEPALIVTGWWYPFIQVQLTELAIYLPPEVEYVYYADEDVVRKALSEGKVVLFTPEADVFNLQRYGHNLIAEIGQPIEFN